MDKSLGAGLYDVSSSGAPLKSYIFTPGSAVELFGDGAWFRDKDNRYCLFRGANLSSKSKLSPYLPLRFTATAAGGTTGSASPGPAFDSHAITAVATLKQAGHNIIRLVVPWKAVVGPKPGDRLNRDYLLSLQKIIDYLYSNGMFVLIDLHQDLAHELYGGDGFPDWAMAVDDDHPMPDPPPDRSRGWQIGYVLNGDVRATLKSFWNDSTTNTEAHITDFHSRTTFLSTAEALMEFFAQSGGTRDAILGYELFNEPDQVDFSKDCFEEQVLTRFYCCGYEKLKARDPKAFLFIEPRVDWTAVTVSGLPLDLNDPEQIQTFLGCGTPCRPLPSDRVVFSFHFYDPWTLVYDLWFACRDNMQNKQQQWPGVFRHLVKVARDRRLIPFMTEYGTDQHWKYESNIPEYPNQRVAYLDLQLQQIEATLLNAMQWVCEPYYDDASGGDGSRGDGWNDEEFSMLNCKAELWPEFQKVIPRAYPLRSSVLPTMLRFDSFSSQAALAFTGDLVHATNCPSAPTVIYLPQLFHYPVGFEVRASCSNPATDLWWDNDKSLLYWNPDRGDRAHYVVVCKPGEFNRDALPDGFPAVGGEPPWTWAPS